MLEKSVFDTSPPWKGQAPGQPQRTPWPQRWQQMQPLAPVCPEALLGQAVEPGSQGQPLGGRTRWETHLIFHTQPQTASLDTNECETKVTQSIWRKQHFKSHKQPNLWQYLNTHRHSSPVKPTKLRRVPLQFLQKHDFLSYYAAVMFSWAQCRGMHRHTHSVDRQ